MLIKTFFDNEKQISFGFLYFNINKNVHYICLMTSNNKYIYIDTLVNVI